MSIKLRFEKGSLLTQVTLKDDALPDLMKIVAAYQSDEAQSSATSGSLADTISTFTDLNDSTKDPDRMRFARNWLSQHSASEVLTQIGWQNYPEKILLLGALIETKKGDEFESWRAADIEAEFVAAREQPPGNFSRDIGTAIKNSAVQTVTPRTYRLTRTGWLRVYEGIIRAATRGPLPAVDSWPNQKLVG